MSGNYYKLIFFKGIIINLLIDLEKITNRFKINFIFFYKSKFLDKIKFVLMNNRGLKLQGWESVLQYRVQIQANGGGWEEREREVWVGGGEDGGGSGGVAVRRQRPDVHKWNSGNIALITRE